MPLSTTMIDAAVRVRLGIGLAEFFDEHATAVPLQFTEQLARLAAAETAAEFERPTQPSQQSSNGCPSDVVARQSRYLLRQGAKRQEQMQGQSFLIPLSPYLPAQRTCYAA